MTKLKTLKDIEFKDCVEPGICDVNWCVDEEEVRYELRQEAIKWIKMLKKAGKEIKETCRYEVGWNEGRKEIMLDFFNLTNDDLNE